MSDDETMELVRGSGNVFRDLGCENPDLEQAKAILAAKIIGILDDRGLSTRKAAGLTGFQQADFARVRRVQTGKFTIDRLIKMVHALDETVEVGVTFSDRRPSEGSLQPLP